MTNPQLPRPNSYGPPPGQWAPPQPPPPRANSGLAITSLVLGLVGLVVSWFTFGIPSLLALIFGVVGIRQTGDGPDKRDGRGMAVAGTALGGVILALGALVSALIFGLIGTAATGAAAAIANATPPSTALDSAQPTVPADEATTPPPPALSPSDFRISIKITSKECFGDAGCNISYRPNLTYLRGPTAPEGTYEITYEVRGGDDGSEVDTIDLTDGQYDITENVASTASSAAKLSAVITDVESLN